jgi:hypothetical protein
VRWGRRIISEACGEETRGDGGAQRGCARTGGAGQQGTEGRSAAAPVQGGRAAGTEGRSAAAPVQGGRAAGTEGRSAAAPAQEGGGARG